MEPIRRAAPRPCDSAPHSIKERLEKLVASNPQEPITYAYVSKALGITDKQEIALLRQYRPESTGQ